MRRGVSLVEVMIVLAILSFLAIPVYNLFIFGARGTARVAAYAAAANLAQEPIELLRALPYRTLVDRYREFAPPPLSNALGRAYKRRVDVREVRPGALARIDVTVDWADGSGRTLTLSALSANEETP